jgi:Glycosyl-transferase for dystroglycan
MRRRTLWYRAFCSSPCRKATSFLSVAYVLVWHILIPTTGWLLEVGQRLSSDNYSLPSSSSSFLTKSDRLLTSGGWLLYDKTLLSPESLEEEQAKAVLVASLRGHTAELQQNRLHLFEQIAPNFFHRNDVPPQKDNNAKAQPKGNQQHQQQQKATSKGDTTEKKSANDNKNGKGQPEPLRTVAPMNKVSNQTKDISTENPKRRAGARKLVTVEHISGAARTIHTMDALGANHSSCTRIPLTESERDWATTLVIQTSVNRLWIVKETCHRWKDPIVVVVFISSDPQAKDHQLDVVKDFYSTTTTSCSDLELLQYMASDAESDIGNYPVNRLRNLGLDRVRTSHILILDVDFVPSRNLDETIRAGLTQQQMVRTQHPELNLASEDRQALIVPAFERVPPQPCDTETACGAYLLANSSFLPQTFSDLKDCHAKKDCSVFQSQVSWDSHYSTRSQSWLEEKWYYHNDDGEKRNLKSLDCFHSLRYEPYVVLRWCPRLADPTASSSSTPVAPYYDERFYGYGKNKIELISHLRFMGYQFAILPEGFIVHNPHPESAVKQTWNNRDGSTLHSTMDKLYPDFLKEIQTKYQPDASNTVKVCK